MSVNWAIGAQQQNPLAGFMQGVELGRQHRRENALMQQQTEELDFRREQRTTAQQTAQSERVAQAAQVLGPVYRRLQTMPYEQRRAWLQQVAPRLVARGIPQEVVAGYDPTDQNLQADIDLSQQAAGQPTSFQRDYDFIRQRDPALGETYFRNHAEGAPVVFDVNGDGAPDLVPRSHFNRGQPQAQGGGDLEAQAQAAIAAGADPAAVRARMNQLRQGGPQASSSAGNF